jgi:hypothetical protein
VTGSSGSQPREGTKLNGAFLGFYINCTVFGLAAALATACLIVFPEYELANWLAVVGLVLLPITGFLSWYCLKLARGE